MRKDKARRLLKAEESFLIFQNQIVGVLVVRTLALLGLAVDKAMVFILREVSSVHILGLEALQISRIFGFPWDLAVEVCL